MKMSYRTEVVQNPIFLYLAEELAAVYRERDALQVERDLYKEAHEQLDRQKEVLLNDIRRHERTNFLLHGKVYNLQVTIRRLIAHSGRRPERLVRRTLLYDSSSDSEVELIDLTDDGRDEEL